jgi:hypothetical protein
MNNGAGPGAPDVDDRVSIEIAAKEEAVVRAGQAFSASVRDVSVAGRDSLERAISVVRPVLIGMSVLTLVGVGLALARGPAKRSIFSTSPRASAPPPWSNVARAMAVAFAAAAGRRLVERWLRNHAEAQAADSGRRTARVTG